MLSDSCHEFCEAYEKQVPDMPAEVDKLERETLYYAKEYPEIYVANGMSDKLMVRIMEWRQGKATLLDLYYLACWTREMLDA